MNYKGTGSFAGFVEECSDVMNALDNCNVMLPPLSDIEGVSFGIVGSGEDARLVLDLSEAPIVSVDNVEWSIEVEGTVTEQAVEIKNGKVVVSIAIEEELVE